jgi:hypothetical protein
MQSRLCLGLVLTLSAAVSFVNLAAAASKKARNLPPPGKVVLIYGCAIPVGPPGCLAITYGKTQYNVSAAVPPIPVGNIVNLGGTVTAASNVCPGVNLQDVSWTPTGAACM